ncbi:hypothetical protein CIPAW_05G197500 [Carya illinoinensis]|uniref:Uncharacterized protein n=1 Tax=Carya illinoinensis TaxID=32201 RepID=A0A8T1QMD7_CARIL|nr:hypothetical protein CIPAW_05G197500 [Carya illinoinensis]
MEDVVPLPALFEQALKIHSTAAVSGADQLGMFSANVTMDDISTTNLKYLLVPSRLAVLMEKVAQGDRIQILRASQEKLKLFWEFTSFCEAMEFVDEEELDTSRQKGSSYPVDRRDFKVVLLDSIAKKAAETKLLEINKRKKEWRGFSSKAAASSTPVEAGEEDAWLTTISLAICKAFDLLEMLNKEEEMLSAIKEKQSKEGGKGFSQALDDRSKRAEAWHRNAAARALYTKPAEPITCYICTRCFQPSYRLPTVSIEEAGLREMETMNKWQEQNAKLMEDPNSLWYKDNRKQRPGEEDDEDDDASQEKARAWDDWKDDNPRGAGNKKLTPCG